MAFNTTHSESEREVSLEVLGRFGINPFSIKILAESYMKNVYPAPFQQVVELSSKGHDLMDNRAGARRKVYLEMRAPGKMGKKPVSLGVDNYGLKTACLSYYMNQRPKPISFLAQGIEFHFRTPGIAENAYKNAMRNIKPGKV